MVNAGINCCCDCVAVQFGALSYSASTTFETPLSGVTLSFNDSICDPRPTSEETPFFRYFKFMETVRVTAPAFAGINVADHMGWRINDPDDGQIYHLVRGTLEWPAKSNLKINALYRTDGQSGGGGPPSGCGFLNFPEAFRVRLPSSIDLTPWYQHYVPPPLNQVYTRIASRDLHLSCHYADPGLGVAIYAAISGGVMCGSLTVASFFWRGAGDPNNPDPYYLLLRQTTPGWMTSLLNFVNNDGPRDWYLYLYYEIGGTWVPSKSIAYFNKPANALVTNPFHGISAIKRVAGPFSSAQLYNAYHAQTTDPCTDYPCCPGPGCIITSPFQKYRSDGSQLDFSSLIGGVDFGGVTEGSFGLVLGGLHTIAGPDSFPLSGARLLFGNGVDQQLTNNGFQLGQNRTFPIQIAPSTLEEKRLNAIADAAECLCTKTPGGLCPGCVNPFLSGSTVYAYPDNAPIGPPYGSSESCGFSCLVTRPSGQSDIVTDVFPRRMTMTVPREISLDVPYWYFTPANLGDYFSGSSKLHSNNPTTFNMDTTCLMRWYTTDDFFGIPSLVFDRAPGQPRKQTFGVEADYAFRVNGGPFSRMRLRVGATQPISISGQTPVIYPYTACAIQFKIRGVSTQGVKFDKLVQVCSFNVGLPFQTNIQIQNSGVWTSDNQWNFLPDWTFGAFYLQIPDLGGGYTYSCSPESWWLGYVRARCNQDVMPGFCAPSGGCPGGSSDLQARGLNTLCLTGGLYQLDITAEPTFGELTYITQPFDPDDPVDVVLTYCNSVFDTRPFSCLHGQNEQP